VGVSKRRGLAALLLSAVSAACSMQAAPTPILFDERLPFSPGPDVGGHALQNAVFADGEVTADEYERAMDAAIGCMRDEGFQVEGPLRYPDGYLVVEPGMDPTLRLTLRATVSDEESDRYGEVNGRCQAQWSYAIEQVYLRQFRPSEAEVQAWLERAWTCLEERGEPISSPPTEEEAIGAVTLGCRPWEESG